MFGTIRRHQKWLWIVIAGVTIVSFVIFFNPAYKGGANSRRSEGDYGSLYGRPITRDEYFIALHDTGIEYFLRSQQWPDWDSLALRREALLQVLKIQKQKEFGIQVSAEAVGELWRRGIQEPLSKVAGPITFDTFVTRFLKPQQLDDADFERFLRHQVGLDQLRAAIAAAGPLVTQQEAETLYRAQYSELSASLLAFSASNFTSAVAITSNALSEFYTNRAGLYRIPEKVQVDYARFNITNFLAAAEKSLTNLDQLVEENYREGATNLFPEAKTSEEMKAKVREALIRQTARLEARREAGVLAQKLYETYTSTNTSTNTTSPDAGALHRLAMGLTNVAIGTTAPFDSEEGPQDLKAPPGFIREAFTRTTNEPFSTAILAEDGVYLLALKQRIPSRAPDFKEIEAKVTDDYRHVQAVQLAQQAATNAYTAITNGMAQGKSFFAVCAETGIKAEALPPFSLSTPSLPDEIEDRVSLSRLKDVAFSTPTGTPSPVVSTSEGSFIVYVDKRLPVDETKLKQELPEFLASMRRTHARDAFSLWLVKEVQLDPQFAQRINELYQEEMNRAAARRQ